LKCLLTAAEIAAGLGKDDQDPDGDGMSNGQEFVSGTGPMDAASVLALQMALDPAGGVDIAFDSQAERTYSIHSRIDLSQGDWNQLGPYLPGTGAAIAVEDDNELPSMFYRLEVTHP